MPPQVPTSFIPKKPLDSGNAYRGGGGAGLLFFIALFIFIASVVAAGAAFAYQNILRSSIADKTASLAKAEGAFDAATIQDLVRMDSRINNASTLLQKHVAPSAIFAFLAQQTLQNVQLTSFAYTLSNDNSASVVMAGVARSFSTVALQSDQFGASKLLRNIVFSDIKVAPGGAVTFSVSATIDPALINYAKNLGIAPAQPLPPPALPLPAATTSATTTPPK